ncbi:MAG: hypothetical protein V2A55_03500 [Candidatus Jorgensenbacteria bacterium]
MFYGHEDKRKLFCRLAESDSLSHAYLFYGYSGIGKFQFARALASFLESGKFDFSPLGEEAPLIDSRIFLPDEKGKIGVDAAREVKSFLFGKPFKSPKRLAIIRDAETLTPEAESAFLKIVEEPPENAMIIFIAQDVRVLFAPLRSRLTQVYFRSFSASEIKKFLMERYKISESKAEEIARMSFNRIGRAVNLVGKTNEEKDDELLTDLSNEIISLYFKGVLKNSRILSILMERELAIQRYNLNQNLQRKAIEYILR